MNFSYFTSIGSPGALCRKADFERLTHLPIVEKLINDYRAGDASATKKLPAFNFHAHVPTGIRKSSDAIPSLMYIMDYDKMTQEELERLIKVATPREDEKETTPILLIHITPSGKVCASWRRLQRPVRSHSAAASATISTRWRLCSTAKTSWTR